MMKSFLTVAVLFLFAKCCTPQTIPTDSIYLAQTPPGYTAKVFALPVIGTMRPVERITISSDGKEIYYCEIDTYPANVQRIKYYKYLNNRWQGPFVVFEGFMNPALSVNDSVMYMETNVNTFATAYYSVRNSTGWSTPVRCLSTNQWTHYYQETNLKNYYMSAEYTGLPSRDLGCRQINGSDTSIKNLGKPVNTTMDENDFFIARDESYIIHARSSSSVAGDLYISYKKANGKWTNSKSLGPQVNISGASWEFGCYVTSDNKYLFFTRGGNSWSSYSIYWVRIDNLIDSLKHTNFLPYLNNQIPDQTDTVGRPFSFTIPDSTFIDDDGNNTLTFSATQGSGSALPSWLVFNPVTRTFSGTPTSIGSVWIKAVATDSANAQVPCYFVLNIVNHISVRKIDENTPGSFKLFQNYPNPFNPVTNIKFNVPKSGYVSMKVFDLLGREVADLLNRNLNSGFYSIDFDAKNYSSGIYIYSIKTESFIDSKKMVVLK
ncbi:MAG: T9SS type A sorting domain-containing protein [Ignavibacteriae bacterium]|nr:T9SS type A sorting domain-containing protein [Ignavibacteriota bacterium]